MPRPKHGPLLNQSQIVQTALALLEREGAEALTMRRLARELKVDPMALYYYLPGKDAVMRHVVEAVVAELELPNKERGTWQERIRAICHAYRKLALKYPKTFPIVLAFPDYVPSDFRIAEACLEVLEEAGLPSSTALPAFVTLQTYVEGFALDELTNSLFHAGLSMSELETLEPQAFPRLRELQKHGFKKDLEADFEFGLTLLILGLEQLTQKAGTQNKGEKQKQKSKKNV